MNWLNSYQNTELKFQIKFQQNRCYWKKFVKKYEKAASHWLYGSKNWLFCSTVVPYHCLLNSIEMVWDQLKYHVRHLNVYTSKPWKGVDLIRKVCKENISIENRVNDINHVIKEDKKMRLKTFVDHYFIKKLNLLLSTCLKMMMSIKYPCICKWFDNF